MSRGPRTETECMRRFCVARTAGQPEVFATRSSRICITCQDAETAKREAAKREARAASTRKIRALADHSEARSVVASIQRQKLQEKMRVLRAEVRALRQTVSTLDQRVAKLMRQQVTIQQAIAPVRPTFRVERIA